MEGACNINARGRQKRLILGVPLIIIGVVASFMSKSFLGQVVAFFGFLSVFQALDGTCVAMAARGALETEEGTRRLLSNPEDVEYFRNQAKRIYVKTFLATLALILAGRAWLWVRG